MATYREEEDPFEEDIVFDQAGLLSTSKMNTAIRRVSSGKCVLFAKTLGLCGAFFGLGLCIAIPGPTFLSPLTELEGSLSPIPNIYIARTSGYVIGSIIGGVLFDRFNRLFLLFLSLLLTAVFITVTPWCQVLWILESCMIILGITMGFLDTGGNVLCLDLWGRNSGPFMQALHFSFGLGAIVAPLLAAPFLEPSFANSTLSTEFSHAITEFPVHLEDPKIRRFRREADPIKDLFKVGNEENLKNLLLNNSLLSDTVTNTSEVPASSVSLSESNPFTPDIHSDSFSNPSSTPSTSTKPRVPNRNPKRKPSKTDASKLGNTNWDKVPVGKPPASDLLPLSTTSTLPPSPPSFSPIPPVTESAATVSSDLPASLKNFASVSTFTDSHSSVTTSEHTTPPSILNRSPSTFQSGSRETFLSNSTSTSTTLAPQNTTTLPAKPIQSFKDLTFERNPFSTNSSPVLLDELPTPFSGHNTRDSSTHELKDDIVNDKSELYTYKHENYSHFALPTRNSSSQPREQDQIEKSILSRKNTVKNPSHLTSINQKPSKKVHDPNSAQHVRIETPINRASPERAMFYNFKEPLLENKYYENTTPYSDFKSSLSYQNTNGSLEENVMHVEAFAQKSDDESAMLGNGDVSSTFNSLSTIAKIQQGDDSVSVSSLENLTSPISTPVPSHSHHVHHKPGTFDNDTEHINTIFDIFANRIEKYGFNKIQFTYLVVGIFVFLISLVFLGFLCHNPRDPKSKQEGQGGKKITNKVVHKLLIALMAFFFFLYMGLEVTYGLLVLAFSIHSNLQLAQSTGSVIAIVFWGSFAAMRFASIFFSSGFSPLTMLMLNFTFCTAGTILVSALANHLETALWVGTALIGIGLASMFPTGILWIERYIHVSNKVAAVFVIGVALGEMICPITIYQLMVIEPMLFMYAALVINIVCILTFASLWWLASRQGEKYSVINNNGYQLANQHDEEEDMMDMSPSGSGVLPRRHSFSSEHRALLNGNVHRGP